MPRFQVDVTRLSLSELLDLPRIPWAKLPENLIEDIRADARHAGNTKLVSAASAALARKWKC